MNHPPPQVLLHISGPAGPEYIALALDVRGVDNLENGEVRLPILGEHGAAGD